MCSRGRRRLPVRDVGLEWAWERFELQALNSGLHLRCLLSDGLTETSSASTSNNGEDYVAKPDSCGPPCPTVDVKVVDENGNDLGRNKVGEVGYSLFPTVTSILSGDLFLAASFSFGFVDRTSSRVSARTRHGFPPPQLRHSSPSPAPHWAGSFPPPGHACIDSNELTYSIATQDTTATPKRPQTRSQTTDG